MHDCQLIPILNSCLTFFLGHLRIVWTWFAWLSTNTYPEFTFSMVGWLAKPINLPCYAIELYNSFLLLYKHDLEFQILVQKSIAVLMYFGGYCWFYAFGIFQISKKQHELVKSMKHSGKSIQSRSMNSVLGNLDTLHVQPYEVFVEEERKKLHDHWLVCHEVYISFL